MFGGFTLAILCHQFDTARALRFCAAFGIGGGMPMAIALISDYVKVKRRALFVTLLFLATPRDHRAAVCCGGDRASIRVALGVLCRSAGGLGLPRSCSFGFRSRCAIGVEAPGRRADSRLCAQIEPGRGVWPTTSFTIDEA